MTACVSPLHSEHGVGDATILAAETTTCQPGKSKTGPVCVGCWDAINLSDETERFRCPTCHRETRVGAHHLVHTKVADL